MVSLSLPEALVVLGLDTDKGTTRHRMALSYAIAGAQLCELLIAERIAIDDHRVVAVDTSATGDEDLDELLMKIAGADRPREPGHWVMKRRSAGLPVYARRLVATGVLRGESRRLLAIVPRTVFPVVDAGTHENALEEIRAALADPAPPPPRTAALIALVHVTGDARRLIGDREQRERAEQIASEDVIASAVKRAIDAVNASASGAITGDS